MIVGSCAQCLGITSESAFWTQLDGGGRFLASLLLCPCYQQGLASSSLLLRGVVDTVVRRLARELVLALFFARPTN